MKAKKIMDFLLAAVVAVTVAATAATSDVSAATKKPAKPAGVSAKSSAVAQMTISWKKVSGAKGYQVRIGTNKKTTTAKKVKTISSGKTVKTTFKSLKQGKKYYGKVRAFKKVGGKKVYGKWSAVKTVTIKKKAAASTKPTTSTQKPSTTNPTTAPTTNPSNPTNPTNPSNPTTPTKPSDDANVSGGDNGGNGGVSDTDPSGECKQYICTEKGVHAWFVADVTSTNSVKATTQMMMYFVRRGADHRLDTEEHIKNNVVYSTAFHDRQNSIYDVEDCLCTDYYNSQVDLIDSRLAGIITNGDEQLFMDTTEIVGSQYETTVNVPLQGGEVETTYICLICGTKKVEDTTNCQHFKNGYSHWRDSDETPYTDIGSALVEAEACDSDGWAQYCDLCGVYRTEY